MDASWTYSDRIYDHNSAKETFGKKESWLVYTLTGFYSVTEDLTVSVGVPYAVKSNVDYDDTSGLNTGVVIQGLGDVFATGRYTVFRQHSLDATLAAGVFFGLKAPTGSTDAKSINGEVVDRHAMPGTGSCDWRGGISASYSAAAGYQFTLDFLYNYAGAGKWAGQSHRFGDSINASAKGYYRIAGSNDKPFFLYTGPMIDWTAKEKGRFNSGRYAADDLNNSTGGTTDFWEVGAYAVLSPTATFNLSFAPAVYHDMNFDPNQDADPAESYKVDLALTLLF